MSLTFFFWFTSFFTVLEKTKQRTCYISPQEKEGDGGMVQMDSLLKEVHRSQYVQKTVQDTITLVELKTSTSC